jgi:hypothetical protein
MDKILIVNDTADETRTLMNALEKSGVQVMLVEKTNPPINYQMDIINSDYLKNYDFSRESLKPKPKPNGFRQPKTSKHSRQQWQRRRDA